jgi:hypothetical protein
MIVMAKSNDLVVIFDMYAAPTDAFSVIFFIGWREAAGALAYRVANFAAASLVACIGYRALLARRSNVSSMGERVKHA